MKPIPFLAVVAPPIAAAMTLVTLLGIVSWMTGLLVFYGAVAVAQIGYLATAVLRHRECDRAGDGKGGVTSSAFRP